MTRPTPTERFAMWAQCMRASLHAGETAEAEEYCQLAIAAWLEAGDDDRQSLAA